MASEKSEKILDKFKVNDRVRRSGAANIGCQGTIKDVRSEVTATTGDSKEKGLLVSVLWDNGTFSYFGPEGIEIVK